MKPSERQIPTSWSGTSFPVPVNEAHRLDVLRGYKILDTEPEQGFTELAQLAAFICAAPIALISLVDENRQWFKARVGLSESETSRDVSFCAHAIMGSELLIVPDATKDDRFAGNPLVTKAPNIRFYAGAPMVSEDAVGLGALCVIDNVPRQLTEDQQEALRALSRQVLAQMQLRKNLIELDQALTARERSDRERDQVIQDLQKALAEINTLQKMIPICPACKKIRDEEGLFQNVEAYLRAHTKSEFTHAFCPSCLEIFYGGHK